MSSNFLEILKRYEDVDTMKGTDKNTSHSYGEVYEKVFSEYKNTTSILEIGFACGGSLLAYADYFPYAMVYGIDIEENLREEVRTHERILTYIGDAKKKETIEYFGKTYDIIIEDASHMFEDQVRHFFDYGRFVNAGGCYIIEDIPGNTIESLRANTSAFAAVHGFTLTIYDLREKKGRWDDVLFVFQKTR